MVCYTVEVPKVLQRLTYLFFRVKVFVLSWTKQELCCIYTVRPGFETLGWMVYWNCMNKCDCVNTSSYFLSWILIGCLKFGYSVITINII